MPSSSSRDVTPLEERVTRHQLVLSGALERGPVGGRPPQSSSARSASPLGDDLESLSATSMRGVIAGSVCR
jgi:hypothetical protein